MRRIKSKSRDLNDAHYAVSGDGKNVVGLDKTTTPKTYDFFKQHLRTEKGEPYETTDGWEYLQQLLNDDSQTIIIVKGRQVGASTYIIGKILHNAMKYPRTMHVYLSDTLRHARDFARIRFHPMLRDSGLQVSTVAKKASYQKDLIMEVRLPNGSIVMMMSSQDEFKQAQSYSIDFLYLDEAHVSEIHALGALEEGMSKSKYGRIIIAGIGAPQGSAWHDKWLTSSMQEWTQEEGKWVAQNPDSKIAGYHIPQSLMPYITESDLAAKLRKYGQVVFDMHCMGLFSKSASTPLMTAEARACYYKADMPVLATRKRSNIQTFASLDLAQSDDEHGAKTCLTIAQYDIMENMLHVLNAYGYNESRNAELTTKITSVLQDYQPDHIISDAGGNLDLLQRLRASYKIKSCKSQNLVNTQVSYTHVKEDMFVISKSYFLERVFARFHDRQIMIPNCADLVPWTIEHLTADTSELVEPAGSTPYKRYSRLPKRQDDFLQTLMFLEAYLYTMTDAANPGNERTFAFAQYDPADDMV